MSSRFCMNCGKREMAAYGGRCPCGSSAWKSPAPLPNRLPPSTWTVRPAPPRPTTPAPRVQTSNLLPPAPHHAPHAIAPPGATRGPTEMQLARSREELAAGIQRTAPVQLSLPRPRKPIVMDVDEDGWVRGRHTESLTVIDYEGSRLNDELGGIMSPAMIFVVGLAGCGKSTASAQLAAMACRYWQRAELNDNKIPAKIYWLDADQNRDDLVKRNFEAAQVLNVFERDDVRMLPKYDAAGEPRSWTFDQALEFLPKRARIVVFDSLERWAGLNPNAQQLVAEKIQKHEAMLKIVIVGANKQNKVSGLAALERTNDATVIASRVIQPDGNVLYNLSVNKCRWSPCHSVLQRRQRQAGEKPIQLLQPKDEEDETSEVDEEHEHHVVEQEEEAPPSSDRPMVRAERVTPPSSRHDAIARVSDALDYYMDDKFLVEATSWNALSLMRFHGRLMKLGFPETFYNEWLEAVKLMGELLGKHRKTRKSIEEDAEEDHP